MPQPNLPRVLSIQSHVVHGYVGNKCVVLPLNRLGFEVDTINSVQFSNHTGYPKFQGTVMSGDELLSLIDGLEENGLLQYTHLLTGYIGSDSLLRAVSEVVTRLRRVNPDLIYVCDPVQGDDEKLYCHPDLPETFRNVTVPLASILTPNQFEAELITGMKIADEKDAYEVCKRLHEKGPHTVIITSIKTKNSSVITVVASTTKEQKEGRPQVLLLEVPRVEAYFTGTGDLFTALLLAQTFRFPDCLTSALEAAMAGLQSILVETVRASGEAAHSKQKSAAISAARELRLVQCQDAIVEPLIKYKARALSLDRIMVQT